MQKNNKIKIQPVGGGADVDVAQRWNVTYLV